MELIKLDLISKNNKKNGFYLYVPIVLIRGDYYRCNTIKSIVVLRKEDVNIDGMITTSCISPEYYEANGLK